jgi:hypothetical protein
MDVYNQDTTPRAWSTPLSDVCNSFTAEFYYGFDTLSWIDVESFIASDALRANGVTPRERLRSFVLSAFPQGEFSVNSLTRLKSDRAQAVRQRIVFYNYDFLTDSLDLDLTSSHELGIFGIMAYFDHRPSNRLLLFQAFLTLLGDIRDRNGNELVELSAFLLSQCATRSLPWRCLMPWIQEDHLIFLLDEAFLSVAKKMVSRYSLRYLSKMHDILYADTRRRTVKVGGVLWPLGLAQPRSQQYIREHIRKQALMMTNFKACGSMLPGELVNMVYVSLLELRGLVPDDRRIMQFTWRSFGLSQLSLERKPLKEGDRLCCRVRSPDYRLQTSQDAFVWSLTEHAYVKYHAVAAYVVNSLQSLHLPSRPRPGICDIYYFRCGDARFQNILHTAGQNMQLYRMGRMNFLVPAEQKLRRGHVIAEEA